MKIKKPSLVDYLTFWLPLKIGTIIGGLSAARAYHYFKLTGTLAAESRKTDVAFLAARGETLFYVLFTLTIFITLVSSILARIQNLETKRLISRVDWTVERLASIDSKPKVTTPTEHSKWPWGSHHTEALGHLEAAAKRFWADLYDPLDPSTAPTNEMVENWLIKERNVSKQKASAIASILRVDGLRTGPR